MDLINIMRSCLYIIIIGLLLPVFSTITYHRIKEHDTKRAVAASGYCSFTVTFVIMVLLENIGWI